MTMGWAVYGIGKLADLEIAPAIARQRESMLVAACSRDRARAQAFADRHAVSAAYDDYAAMIADPAVDVVYIATPNAWHAEHALAALRSGKHVLVEKPMTLSVESAREVVAAATAADVRLGVGFHLRHKPTNRAAREAIQAGRIGRLEFLNVSLGAGQDVFPYDTWRADTALAGGGTLLNQGTHVIDLVEFLAGQPLAEVYAYVDDKPVEDIFAATCRLRHGAVATLSSHQVRGGTRRDWIAVGREGWLEGRSATAAAAGDEVVLHDGEGSTVLATSERSAYDEEVDAFTRAVLGTEPVSGDGEDGLRNVVAVEAFYRAARERRSVEL